MCVFTVFACIDRVCDRVCDCVCGCVHVTTQVFLLLWFFLYLQWPIVPASLALYLTWSAGTHLVSTPTVNDLGEREETKFGDKRYYYRRGIVQDMKGDESWRIGPCHFLRRQFWP